ncbi:MAG: protein kinase [Anaerolineae bacterium]|nr:protein kinase [Anaerolineae bacterium]MCI0610389.1 protein kinase [Anaerolineae bacterium]
MQPEKIGRYEIKSELGRGGMATVYRGYDPRFEREVAVKVLPPELLHADPQFKLRFEREAKIIAQLEHSAIVPVYDVDTDGDQPYFVMRYMTGGSLSERIKAGVFTIEEATRILERVGPGLDEAHSKGIVHRDIKPSNILFDNRGTPYISDFGIAKLSQAQAGNVTGSAIIGTPAYMAPEQAQGDTIDGRIDIYALGIILYEMVTGRQPYEADTPMAVALKHITDPVPHILTANPKLPQGMDMVIQKAMAKDRNDRFSSSKEMIDALHAVMRGDTTKLQPVSAPKTIKGTAIQRPVVAEKKGLNVLALVIPVLALAAIAGGIFLFNGINRPSATEAPVNTSTSGPATETSEPTSDATEAVILPAETSTEAPPAPTETVAAPSAPVIAGADKIAFVANNEIWLMNMDGSELEQLTNDGGVKNDLQWMPDGETILFISGKTIKHFNITTGTVDTLTSFPSAVSLNAFRVSHDGKQVMIAMSNEIFVLSFDFETWKNIKTRANLFEAEHCILPEGKTRSALKVKEARWSADDKLVAWLFAGVDAGNSSMQSDQVSVFDIQACEPAKIDTLDNFPGTRFVPVGFQSRIMPDFDWDGVNLFAFNTDRRNNGWGELYVYDWIIHKAYHINPINNACCYRDARWSPDGTYLFFAFQDFGLGSEAPTLFYYVPYGLIGTGSNFDPIPLPEGFYENPREAPQAALHPAP